MLTLLPECLAKTVICEWLEADAVKLLDTASCVRKWRGEFLSLLSGQVISKVKITRTAIVSWMLLRKVTSRDVLACGFQCERYVDLVIRLLNRSASIIHSFHVTKQQSSLSIQSVVSNRCFKLTAFSTDLIGESDLRQILYRNHNSINVLNVLNVQMTSSQHQYTLPALTQLRELSISIAQSSSAAFICEILAVAEHLQKLCLTLSKGVIFSFLTPCPHLKSLKVRSETSMLTIVTKVVTHCPCVVNLDLQFSFHLTDDDVLTVATLLHHLRTLNVYNCLRLTNQTLQHLGDHRAATLQLLHLGGNKSMTRAKMDMLMGQCKLWNNCLTLRCVQALTTARLLCNDEATVLVTCAELNDTFVSGCVAHSHAEILRLCAFHFHLTVQGLTDLCTKLPKLHTLVVNAEEESWLKLLLAQNFSQLTVTSDSSVYEYEVITLTV